MQTQQRDVIRITPEELPHLIRKAKDEAWESLAILGPLGYLDSDIEENRYQLTDHVPNLAQQLVTLRSLTQLYVDYNNIGDGITATRQSTSP